MAGPWFRSMPNPGTTRVVTTVAQFDAAYAASIPGDRIQLNAGTYVFTGGRAIDKPNIQIVGNGHALWDGFMTVGGAGAWIKDLEISDVDISELATLITVGADNVSIVNNWLHHTGWQPTGGAGYNAILNPAGFGGTLIYGNVCHDTRHIMYLQNLTTEAKCWTAHNFIGDGGDNQGSNSYGIHEFSSSSPLNERNWSHHENILANSRVVVAGQTVSEIVSVNEFKGNMYYRSSHRMYTNRPQEITFQNNRMYETAFEMGSPGPSWPMLEFLWVHGAGETEFGYLMPTTVTGCLFYKPDASILNWDLQTSAYVGPGIRLEGKQPLRSPATGELTDNNQYYGTFNATSNINNVFSVNMASLAAWRTATLNGGNQYDINSTFTAGVPPNYYIIWQNDYNPDRAMIAAFIYTGANMSVTLPRAGDIYDVKAQWSAAVYSGGTTYNVAPQGTTKAFFGIIKYTGGAMPQFARPNSDFNNPGTWTNQAASSTNIYQAIDETIADDADFIQSPVGPTTTKVYVTKLSSITDPVSSSGHVLRWRYNKDAAGGAQINLVAELRQGYVSEASLGTLIVSRSFTNVSDTFVTDAYTLSGGEADSISNYGDLYLRFTATQV